MSLTTSRRRPVLAALAVALLMIVPAVWVSASSAATAVAATPGTTPSGGSVETDVPEPTPLTSTDYDGEVGGPHQDTPDERVGEAVSTGRLVFIGAVVVVTAGIVLTLALRARRRRDPAGGR
ncbi:hypothetical protein [Cellulomonas xylanilytica]|uniref:Uncharacterized protein n=1 Tax=Cellulomonas xylanilytica TaxID=233583 RepID=A0A510V9M6_9CELL|nr:hypothetical protein [Cellulomonas xylanilytica]GEK23446.1 hypothetical protein CXY01_39660 [Cellulomonas xylanilytica]